MARGVIVADDLTGAADACATFVTRGCTGAVVFDTGASSSAASTDAEGDADADADADVDIVTVSTDTRGLPVTLAIDRVRAAVSRLTTAHPSALLFKKIDSTLRGHVGRELTATIEVSGARLAIVAPAFPAMGRTVRDGVLTVTGAGTLKPRHVTTLLEDQGVRACRHLARPQNGCDWRSVMTSAVSDDARVLVCDSISDDDLDAIVRAAWTLDGPLLWVGSAGLADAVARQVPIRGHAPRGHTPQTGPVVFWIGSHHPVTIEQRRALLARPGVAAAGGSVNSVERVTRLLDRHVHTVLDVGPAVSDETIARLVERVVDRPVGGFVMSGGETAARVCRLLDASAIRLAGEVSRGIPHGSLLTRSGRRWPVVLKSGGFGTPRVLLDVLAFLCPTPN